MNEARWALARAIPDERYRCRALLNWCGSGTARYSGIPVYETMPGELLAQTPVGLILHVLQHDQALVVRRGAVLCLGGWRRPAQQLQFVPPALRQQLLAVADGQDEVLARRLRESWARRG